MKLATVQYKDKEIVAIRINDTTLVELGAAYAKAGKGEAPKTTLEIAGGGAAVLATLREVNDYAQKNHAEIGTISTQDITWLPPLRRPGKMIGVAFNNNELTKIAHVLPKAPMYFLKPATCLVGHNDPIVMQENYGYTIPELEMAAIIGKRGSHIPESEALDYIFGYSIINDITSSGLKFALDSIAIDMDPKRVRPHHVGWRRRRDENDNELYFTYHSRSKGSDSFGPMGPWLTTADEVKDPNKIEVKGWLGDELFAVDSTENYNFTIQQVIADASKYFTLEPGDIIHFGTSGRGHGRFTSGHLSVNLYEETGPIVIEVEGLGRLSNPVKHSWKK